MAKRKTLKRQRDNALKEIELLKKQMYQLNASNIMRHEQHIRIFTAQYDVSELKVSQGIVDAITIVRKMLHTLVDEGYFDDCVSKSAEYDISHRKIKNEIAIEILQPQANYESEMFSHIWTALENSSNSLTSH